MERAAIRTEFLRYILLSVLGTLGVSCYILVDTYFVAEGLGSNGLAALNIAIPAYNLIHGTGLMIGMGAATKFSICKSQGNQGLVNRIYTNTLYLALAFSIIYMLPAFFCSRQIASLLGANAEILELTNTYLQTLMLFSPALILNNIFLCLLRNDGSPHLAMMATLMGSCSNMLMDYIFIFPCKMGMLGAILATGISPILSMLMMTPHWLKRKNTFHFIKTKIDLRIMSWDLSIGFPSFVAQISTGIVMITFNAIILQLEGNIGIAAYGVIANIALVVTGIHTGIGQGVQPLISRYFGQGKHEQLQLVYRYAKLTAFAASALMYAVIFVFATPITAVFNSEGSATLQMISELGLKLYFLSAPFVGYNTILATYFTSIEKTLPAHVLSILRGLILILPIAFILAYIGQMVGVWLAYPVTECIAAILGFCIFNKQMKKRKQAQFNVD
ncbi:MATE family efflux transporter [Allobaculum stercoricanis]|uniref:MATE family efflux transporter n=1 Tax=Allobaculum stercoricanis TaxID=174709 RepID=UPI00035E374D|nr:MATE family efflux transporter [Allobaculum stercoricanis]